MRKTAKKDNTGFWLLGALLFGGAIISKLSGRSKPDYTLEDFGEGQLSEWFNWYEFTHSNTAVAEGIPNIPNDQQIIAGMELAQWVLDPIRNYLGGAVKVNSWFRSPELNQWFVDSPQYDAAVFSYHMTGGAADIKYILDGVKRNDLLVAALLATDAPFRRILIEKGTLDRPAWIQIEYDPDVLPQDQIRQILVIPEGSGTTGYYLSREEAVNLYPASLI